MGTIIGPNLVPSSFQCNPRVGKSLGNHFIEWILGRGTTGDSFSYMFLLFMRAAASLIDLGNKMVEKSHGALLLLSKLKSKYERVFGDF